MNTNFAQSVSLANFFANEGCFATDGMLGLQELSFCVLTRTV